MNKFIELKQNSKGESEDLSALLFCAKIIKNENKDPIVYTTRVLIKGYFAYGTDSKRLHRAKLSRKYKDGLYRVLKCQKKHIILYKSENLKDGIYPNYNRFFKNIGRNQILFKEYIDSDNYSAVYTKIIRSIPQNVTLNYEWLKDINGQYSIKFNEKFGIVIFENDNKVAVVMIIKIF